MRHRHLLLPVLAAVWPSSCPGTPSASLQARSGNLFVSSPAPEIHHLFLRGERKGDAWHHEPTKTTLTIDMPTHTTICLLTCRRTHRCRDRYTYGCAQNHLCEHVRTETSKCAKTRPPGASHPPPESNPHHIPYNYHTLSNVRAWGPTDLDGFTMRVSARVLPLAPRSYTYILDPPVQAHSAPECARTARTFFSLVVRFARQSTPNAKDRKIITAAAKFITKKKTD